MLEHLLLQGIVARVILRSDRPVEERVHFCRKGRSMIAARGSTRSHDTLHSRVDAAARQKGVEIAHQRWLFQDLRISPLFEEFIVGRVDNKEVGMVVDQLLHQPRHPVTGVADAAAIDHFPPLAGIGLPQEGAQPSAERCPISVGPSVGSRSPQAEDAVSPRRSRLANCWLLKKSSLLGAVVITVWPPLCSLMKSGL